MISPKEGQHIPFFVGVAKFEVPQTKFTFIHI